jgi:hypothetical protein
MENYKEKENIIDDSSDKNLEVVELSPYSDQELELTPDVEKKIENLLEFFQSYDIPYDKFDLDGDKKAYPNINYYMYIPGQHDIGKWIKAMQFIRFLESRGAERAPAIRQVTSGWNVIETFDFLNWIKFYGAGEHMKYKFAQLWYENGAPGYFLPIKKDPPVEPAPRQDIDFAISPITRDEAAEEKKNIIEKQRSKIIGRLDSVEKLLRSRDGHLFADKELETLIDAVYQLKKKIYLVNKVSASTKLYEDMIIREANILTKNGFTKAGEVLFSVAEDKVPAATPPAPPAQGQGAAGGLPSTGPGAPTTPPDTTNDNSPVEKFLDNLETGNVTTREDKLEVEDTIDISDVEDELLVTEAQAAPPPPPPPPSIKPPVKPPADIEEPLEVTEEDVKPSGNKSAPTVSDFDSKVSQVFSDISVADVVTKLEDLAKVFKTREIPRQLGIIDMMLDSLGLASYFPSLSEATNKALESNNYISTRVEDILSKLRGSMGTNEIDLKGSNNPEKPEVAGIKQKLQSDEDKEKSRKQMRKDQETAELEGKTKETPEVEIEEDLGAPPPPPPPKAAPPVPKQTL